MTSQSGKRLDLALRRRVEHVGKYWCGTITSDQVLGGKPFRFRADRRGRRRA